MNPGKRILRGGALSYGSFLASKALVYVSTLLLARLLAPRDFGLVGYALLVLSYLDVMKDLGVNSALIYRQDIDDKDAGEAFTLNVLSGLVFFALCWVVAPLAAGFFHDARVTALTRVLGFSFVLYGVGGVHGALLQKRMRFGRGVLPDLTQGLVKGVVSIGLAAHGLGFWSLAWGQLAGICAGVVGNWLLFPWRPRLCLRWATAKRLLGYGLHITLINLLGAAIYNGDYVIVGRWLGSGSLGLYSLAYSIPQMLTISLAVALSRVIFPAYAALKGDVAALRQGYLAVLRYSSMVVIPVGFGLSAAAPAFVHVLYRPSWWPAVPALQALAIYAALYAVGWNAGDIYKATGRPDIQWKLDIAHAVVLLPSLLVGALVGGFVGVAVAQVVVAVPYSLARFWLIGRVIHLRMTEIVRVLCHAVIAGVAQLGACSALAMTAPVTTPPLRVMFGQIAVGGAAYLYALLVLDGDLRGHARALLMGRERRLVRRRLELIFAEASRNLEHGPSLADGAARDTLNL